jgi:hypothetical protein
MSTTKSNKIVVPKKNTTIKSKTVKSKKPSRNNAIKHTYNKDYYGKDTLPTTNIIQYIESNFNDYMAMKQQKSAINLPPSSFEDFFIVDDILKKKETKADIDIQINKNPNATLDKLLAHGLYYSEYKNWFKTKKMDTSLFKYQIGKDASRIDLTINKTKFNFIEDENNSLKTDKFNIELINILSKFKVVDLDLINKIGIVMCQNTLNFITDLISLMLFKKLEPEKIIIRGADKNAEITLTKNQENMIYNFHTDFWITKDDVIVDGDFLCGQVDLSYLIDFKKNTYKITKFKCKYDADICYQTANSQQASNAATNAADVPKKDYSNYLKYGIPIGVGVGAIVATPFLLALGGKNKKSKRKRNKKRKSKTKKYFYN